MQIYTSIIIDTCDLAVLIAPVKQKQALQFNAWTDRWIHLPHQASPPPYCGLLPIYLVLGYLVVACGQGEPTAQFICPHVTGDYAYRRHQNHSAE